MTTENDESESTESTDINISRFRQMAIRGHQYRESLEFEYYTGEDERPIELYVRPLTDDEFLPIAAFLEDRLDIDVEEAQEKLEDEKSNGSIDPSQFDEEFVDTMKEAAVMGIDTSQGDAEGETEEGVREILGATDHDNDIGLQAGKTLIIAERVLNISSDADKAETFRNGRGGE